jgi:hypothetical protein
MDPEQTQHAERSNKKRNSSAQRTFALLPSTRLPAHKKMDVVTTAGGTSQLVLEQSPKTAQVHTLRLRARPRVNWEADVVDNEHAGKQKSNREQPYFIT